MNEPLPPNPPHNPQGISSGDFLPFIEQPQTRSLPYWLRRFFACNPFYLVSAALLLYGFYRISVDPGFLSKETAHLLFNFTSLQFYELLLVLTAIFLARRKIWYDSTLLVGLENMLLLVPFILISQAALIDPRMVWTMCLLGGLMALLRCGGLKRFIAELNLPAPLLITGLVLLLVNVAFPVAYRLLHEHKFGTRLESGPAYYTNECAWLLLLPALCGLVNFLPRAGATGELLPQRRWLPIGLFSLWLLGTGVHLYCLGYVYDFSLRPELLAPAIWLLLWTLRRRLPDFVPQPNLAWQRTLLVLPLLATFLAASQSGSRVFLTLTLLNARIYNRIYFCRREDRLALHLVFLSLGALIAECPQTWLHGLVTEFSRAKCVGAGAAAYFLLCSAFSRHPAMGLFGALLAAGALLVGLGADALHWAAQIGLAFLLMHSLRWEDAAHQGARALRIFTCAAWVIHAFFWMRDDGQPWMSCAVVTPVLAAYLAARLLHGHWGPFALPLAAILVALAGPADSAAIKVQTAPVGLLAVLGSFLLFAVGTLAALTRHRWNKEAP